MKIIEAKYSRTIAFHANYQRVGQGSALMDFFVDPTQIFASERHPALQEVLAVLSKSKKHRGILENNMHKSLERVFFNRPLILL